MSDDTTATPDAPAADGDEPQAGTHEAPPPAGEQHDKTSNDTSEVERLTREVSELRKENASRRTKLKAFEDAAQAEADAKLSEVERATKAEADAAKRAEAAEAKVRKLTVDAALKQEATKLGFADPSDAVTFLAGDVELDESGEPVNAADAVKALAEQRPHLIAPTSQPGRQTSPTRSGKAEESDTDRWRRLNNRDGETRARYF